MGMFSFLGKKDADRAGDAGGEGVAGGAGASPAPPAQPTPLAPPAPAPPAPAPPAPPASPAPLAVILDPAQTAALQGKIIEVLKTVFDPEIPVDIYELGLIYDIIVDAEKRVQINMTLTSPACPSAQQIPAEVKHKVKSLPDVTDVFVDIVWEPAWSKERMSETAKLTLGFF